MVLLGRFKLIAAHCRLDVLLGVMLCSIGIVAQTGLLCSGKAAFGYIFWSLATILLQLLYFPLV